MKEKNPTGSLVSHSSRIHLLLLYDGECGFCSRSVQFVLRHERQRTMHFAPLQGSTAKLLCERRPELERVDSMVLVENCGETNQEKIWIRSSAALRIASYLGGPWHIFRAIYLIPRPLRDLFYDWFARHRYRIFERLDRCWIPPERESGRFLDLDEPPSRL